MGERKETVFSYGCPSVDVVSKIRKYPSPTILNEGVGPELNFAKEYLLVLFHPVTTEYSSSEKQMEEVLSAIKELNMQTLLIWPNIDAGSDGVSQAIRRFREYNNSTQLHAYKNFEPEEYIPLLDNAVCAIGNSSSFIRDASFLGTPVVLVGTRQDGRERTKAVIKVVENKDKIVDAVKFQINHGRYEVSNLYGTVGVSTRIVKQFKLLEKYKQKQFVTKN